MPRMPMVQRQCHNASATMQMKMGNYHGVAAAVVIQQFRYSNVDSAMEIQQWRYSNGDTAMELQQWRSEFDGRFPGRNRFDSRCFRAAILWPNVGVLLSEGI